MGMYFALSVYLFYELYVFCRDKQKGFCEALGNNKNQVIAALGLGSVFRLPTVMTTNCVIEEAFRLLKDVRWLAARSRRRGVSFPALPQRLAWHAPSAAPPPPCRCSSCCHSC